MSATDAVTESELETWKALADKATPGPWKLWGMQVMADTGTGSWHDAIPVADTRSHPQLPPRTFNASFIAQARSAMPKLITDNERLNARVAELEAERDQAIAHDRQPYPTAWAYEQACAALEKHRKRAEKAEAAIARVEALKGDLFLRGGNLIAQWGAARLIGAALEGES